MPHKLISMISTLQCSASQWKHCCPISALQIGCTCMNLRQLTGGCLLERAPPLYQLCVMVPPRSNHKLRHVRIRQLSVMRMALQSQ